MVAISDTEADMIDGILLREGGYVDHPSDPGGRTKFGITQKVARANGYQGHMRDLPLHVARAIYFHEYIRGPKFDGIMKMDVKVAEEVIDSGVNAGQARAAKWFQLALNVFNRRQKDYADILVDGDIGPKTLGAFDSLRKVRGHATARALMLRMLNGLQIGHYYGLAEDNSKFEDFMPGWVLHRIGDL